MIWYAYSEPSFPPLCSANGQDKDVKHRTNFDLSKYHWCAVPELLVSKHRFHVTCMFKVQSWERRVTIVVCLEQRLAASWLSRPLSAPPTLKSLAMRYSGKVFKQRLRSASTTGMASSTARIESSRDNFEVFKQRLRSASIVVTLTARRVLAVYECCSGST